MKNLHKTYASLYKTSVALRCPDLGGGLMPMAGVVGMGAQQALLQPGMVLQPGPVAGGGTMTYRAPYRQPLR